MFYVHGPVYDVTGYSYVTNSIAHLLERLGVDFRLLPDLDWSMFGQKLHNDRMEWIRSKLVRTGNINLFEKDVLIKTQMLQEEEIGFVCKKIVYTMFETDRCPDKWINNLNKADMILLPSTFGVETFMRCGVKNCQYLPLFIDTDTYHPEAGKFDLGLPSNLFKFMVVGDLTARKNIGGLIKAFLVTFRNSPDVCLIVKCSMETKFFENIEKNMTEAREQCGVKKYPRVAWYPYIIPEDAMPGFINACDCYVSASCGEGFGIPLLQAMACGKPVISTSWSACQDYINPGNAYVVDHNEKDVPYSIVKQDENFYGHKWGEPVIPHIGQLMKYVFDNRYDELLKGVGKAARETVVKKYSIPVVMELLQNLLKERGLI